MSQIRLFSQMTKAEAEQLAPLVEAAFEEDGYPVANFETDEAKELWTVSIYLDESAQSSAQGRFETLIADAGISTSVEIEELGEQNWVATTLADLAPVRAGRFVVHGSHDAGCTRVNELGIQIDAGMAFGTGHHGTTAGCLNMIERVLKYQRPRNALDLGSGTGVLAVALAKSCRVPVLATDIDPVSAQIAAENAKLNGMGAFVDSITATGFNHTRFADYVPFDLIVANILAGPLQAMAHDLANHLSSHGTVILSGLLPHQRARILAAYRLQGLAAKHTHYQDGWMTLILRNMR